MKEYKWVKENKWIYIVAFVVLITSMLHIASGAVSSWEIMYENTTESWRFWFALGAFICFVSLLIAGIIGLILGLVRIIQNKNKNQSCLVEN